MSQQFVYENWLNQSDRQLTPVRLFTGPVVLGWPQLNVKELIGQNPSPKSLFAHLANDNPLSLPYIPAV